MVAVESGYCFNLNLALTKLRMGTMHAKRYATHAVMTS